MHLSMPYITIDPHQNVSGSIMRDGGTPGTPPGQPHQAVAGGILGAGLIGAPEGQPHQLAPGSILLIRSGSNTPDGIQGHPLSTVTAINTSESPLSLTTPGSLESVAIVNEIPPGQTHAVTSGTSGLKAHPRSSHTIPEAVSIVSKPEHSHLNSVPVTVMLTQEQDDTDRSAEIATLENVRVSGVETLEQCSRCIACSSEVVLDRTDPDLGTCSQCSMMQCISDTTTVLSASLVVCIGPGEFLRLRAFDEAIGSIAQRLATDVDKKALLKAEPFTISHRDGEILSATR